MQRKIIAKPITPKRGRGRPKGSLNKTKVPDTGATADLPGSPKTPRKSRTVQPPENGPLANNRLGGLSQIRLVVDNAEELAASLKAAIVENKAQYSKRNYSAAAKAALECANLNKQSAEIIQEIYWIKKAITCYKMANFNKEAGEYSARLADIYAGLKKHTEAAFHYMQAAKFLRKFGKYHSAGENAVKSAEQNLIIGNHQWAFNAYNLAALCFKDAGERTLEHESVVQKNRLRF